MKIHQMLAKKNKLEKFLATFNDSRKMNEKRVLCFSLFESILKKDETFDQNQTQNPKSDLLHSNK